MVARNISTKYNKYSIISRLGDTFKGELYPKNDVSLRGKNYAQTKGERGTIYAGVFPWDITVVI